jgi:predicted acyltransferase
MILLLIYWLMCFAGNPADPYSLQGWFGTDIDKAILGEHHMYKGEGIPFDPEGLMSTLPSIVQVILGYLVGAYILGKGKEVELLQTVEESETKGFETAELRKNRMLYQTITGLFIASMALLFAGYAWGLSFPVNKKIWTSSYVVLTTGMAIAILATLVYFIEIRRIKGWWTKFFDVFGKNALFVFALSAFLPKGLRLIRIPNGLNAKGEPAYISPWNWIYERVYKFIPGPPEIGSLAFAITVILFMWAICWWMDKKRIYVKV